MGKKLTRIYLVPIDIPIDEIEDKRKGKREEIISDIESKIENKREEMINEWGV